MKGLLGWIFLGVGVFCTCVNSQVLLYYSTPKGQHAGLYGGPLMTTEKGELQVDEKVATHCYHADDGLKTTMKLKAVSVDDRTRSVLMQLEGQDVILLKGHSCQIDQICTNSSVTVLIDGYGSTDVIGPFAMHDGQIYFAAKVKNVEGEETVTAYEVRKINFKKKNCLVEDFPITAGSLFTVEDCSDFAGHLMQEYDDINEKITALDIELVNEDGVIRSIVSMESKLPNEAGITDKYILRLILTDHTKKGTAAKSLKNVEVWPQYSSWVFESTGGLAYQSGRLCWSALDRVLCFKYKNQELSEEKLVLPTGESASSGACSGSDHVLSNVTTGVAFIEKQGELKVFFGCLLTFGGAGVVTIKDDKRTVTPLRTNISAVFAGTMAVADDCLEFSDKAYTIIGYNSANIISIFSLLPSLLLFIIITLLHQC